MIRKAVVLLLILAAGICAYRGSAPYIDARMEQEHLKQAAFPGNEENRSDNESKVKKPVREETVPYTSPIDFEALKSINPDIVGWIQIPGTVIDYPVCWRANDNEYYYAGWCQFLCCRGASGCSIWAPYAQWDDV